MERVLVVGRIRPGRDADVDALLAAGRAGVRLFRQGALLALLVEGPRADARFLRLLAEEGGALARLVDCLEDVPLVPPEVTVTAA